MVLAGSCVQVKDAAQVARFYSPVGAVFDHDKGSAENNTLRLVVKAYRQGSVRKWLCNLAVNSSAEFRGPYPTIPADFLRPMKTDEKCDEPPAVILVGSKYAILLVHTLKYPTLPDCGWYKPADSTDNHKRVGQTGGCREGNGVLHTILCKVCQRFKFL